MEEQRLIDTLMLHHHPKDLPIRSRDGKEEAFFSVSADLRQTDRVKD